MNAVHSQYRTKLITVLWDHSAAGNGLAPDSVTTDAVTEDVSLSLPIDIGQARSIRAEIDTTHANHVASSIDVHFYTGIGDTVPDVAAVDDDAVGDDEIAGPHTIPVGDKYLWITFDHNDDGNRAYVTVLIFIRY